MEILGFRLSKGAMKLVTRAQELGLNVEQYVPHAAQTAAESGKGRVSRKHMRFLKLAVHQKEIKNHRDELFGKWK